MTCNAILVNTTGEVTGKLCTSPCMGDSLFCAEHQTITETEHKNRWFELFILGNDGDQFLYKFSESKRGRILGDLERGIVTLTQEDILQIPGEAPYIDIYLLLMDNGYIGLEENCHPDLFWASVKYISEVLLIAKTKYWPYLGIKILDILILKNTEHLTFFLSMIVEVERFRGFKGYKFQTILPRFSAFLKELLNSDLGKSFLWQPVKNDLLKLYTRLQEDGKPNLVLDYMRNNFVPLCKEMYREEKSKQKARTNLFKEELMMVCWHPDRFVDYCLDEEEKAEIKSLA